MPETITVHDGQKKWTWFNVMLDLKNAGLKDVVIHPSSIQKDSCSGKTEDGNNFVITWGRDQFLLLSMERSEDELVGAFAKVVGYRPVARYLDRISGRLIFEWDKEDPEGCFKSLQDDEALELLRIE